MGKLHSIKCENVKDSNVPEDSTVNRSLGMDSSDVVILQIRQAEKAMRCFVIDTAIDTARQLWTRNLRSDSGGNGAGRDIVKGEAAMRQGVASKL